jgi:hypothetical protein
MGANSSELKNKSIVSSKKGGRNAGELKFPKAIKQHLKKKNDLNYL